LLFVLDVEHTWNYLYCMHERSSKVNKSGTSIKVLLLSSR